MKKRVISVVVVFLSLVCSSAFADQAAALKLSHLLKSFNTYFANFQQVTRVDSGKVIQTSSGTMRIKRPGKFRWESKKPTNQVLITDGKTLWTYDVDLEQVTKKKLSQQTAIDPAMLLSGSIKNLNQNFTITESGKNGAFSFLLKPKKDDLGFSSVALLFQDAKLVSMKVVNSLDQTTLFSFSGIQLNKPMSDSLFTFVAKPGVDVISE